MPERVQRRAVDAARVFAFVASAWDDNPAHPAPGGVFMVVPLVSALESLDDSLIEAAYDLGGNAWSILRQIVIPHAAPGIAAGSIVVFMLTLGNYLTPTLLGGKNSLWFTEQIYSQFITRFNWEQGAAFGFLLLVLSTAIVWLGLALTGQKFGDVMRRS